MDRRALAAQAVRAFASFEPEPSLKFDKIYEVYSQRFQPEDFGEDERFDPKLLPNAYLTNPQPKHAFVYVCTIQRMAVNLFGRQSGWSNEEEGIDDDARQLRIPIHAFDVIVADECHRGYTTAELSVWRNTLDHFDTIKIGLTATPAAHIKAYFRDVVYRYEYALEHEQQYGRFPKTLISAANDLPHTSHADQLVELAVEVFGRGQGFVRKITGRSDRPLKEIRQFRNRPTPGIVVTVDMLSTGVDIPDLEHIVFLRPVKSRILFEQMLGRGTRKGEKHPDKSHFTVFDCFDGTLLKYFRDATAITADPPEKPSRTIAEIIDDIWANRDRDYNVRCLVKRLQRIEKEMALEAREMFAAYIPDGDMRRFAAGLPAKIRNDFTATMQLLRTPAFQELLMDYPRRPRTFWRAIEASDQVSSEYHIRSGTGKDFKPEDYLMAFSRYVQENAEQVEAISILLDRPQGWSTAALDELKKKLASAPDGFTVETLQKGPSGLLQEIPGGHHQHGQARGAGTGTATDGKGTG